MNLTLMVHARTSSGPAVKKYSSWSAAYPALMIFAKALKKKGGRNPIHSAYTHKTAKCAK